MRKKICWKCKLNMEEKTGEIDGVSYKFYKCQKCGEEFLDMKQLHEVAGKYKELRKSSKVKVSRWGTALAIRIPKEIVVQQKIHEGESTIIVPEKKGFKVIPEE